MIPCILTALVLTFSTAVAQEADFEVQVRDSVGLGPPPAYTLDIIERPAPEEHPEDYLFVFATVADSHIRLTAGDDYRYIKALSISHDLLSNYVRDINNHSPPVDFVVHLGDVTDTGWPTEFDSAEVIMDSLECPLYAVVGNHDNFQSDNKELWKQFAGLDTTNYTFDYYGVHFVVIDCTLQPYEPPYVTCDSALANWVAQDLAANSGKPSIILSHYNMWERGWNAKFDTIGHYPEYPGIPGLRQVLQDAGNVAAVVNGHVHANRVEVHDGIYYVDISATLVGRPSIRYFYVYRDSIRVDCEYISDVNLYNHVAALCTLCTFCFDKHEVCDFIDGEASDRRFTIDFTREYAGAITPVVAEFSLDIETGDNGRLVARVYAERPGRLEISLYDVLGRRLDRWATYKAPGVTGIDLATSLPALARASDGIYFLSAGFDGQRRVRKIPILRH